MLSRNRWLGVDILKQLVKSSAEENILKWSGLWRSLERTGTLLRVTQPVGGRLITPSEDSCDALDSSGSSLLEQY